MTSASPVPPAYRTVSRLLPAAYRLAGLFSEKTKRMVKGQQEALERVRAFRQAVGPEAAVAWFHAASLGEFLQAQSLLERIKQERPKMKVAVTFYSPSGYEARKDYPGSDMVCYLPADTPEAARAFLSTLRPSLVFWTKYDFWLNHLSEAKAAGARLFLISAFTRPEQAQGWKKGYYAQAYQLFDAVFLQFAAALPYAQALVEGSQTEVIAVGDTRFDNVLALTEKEPGLDWVEEFRGDQKLIVFGSAWVEDLKMARLYIDLFFDEKVCILVVPHELDHDWVAEVQQAWGITPSLYSHTGAADNGSRVLVLDKVGLLSRVYAYARVAWVGGAFGKGLHNILEAAAWGAPVVFGPKTRKFPEAGLLVQARGAAQVADPKHAAATLHSWVASDAQHAVASEACRGFIRENAGATEGIVKWLKGKGIL